MLTAELSTKTLKLLRTNIAESFKVPYNQLPRVLFHGAILSSIISGFWLLDSLKDPIIANTVGIEYQPYAKLLSVLATLFIVCIYDFLTSIVSKPVLFHIISGFFGITAMIISALLSDPNFGLSNGDIGPHRLLGWFAFCTIEAYGSLMVAMFWSFTNSIMDLEQAKGAYGLIIAVAQVGAIVGSTLATNASSIGISQLFLIGSVMIFSVSLLIKSYNLTFRDAFTEDISNSRIRTISKSSVTEPLIDKREMKESSRLKFNDCEVAEITTFTSANQPINILNTATSNTVSNAFIQSFYNIFGGFSEGLLLLLRYPYMIKLLGVSCLYEVVVTILDYQFKVLGSYSVQASLHSTLTAAASEAGLEVEAASDRFANLLGHFGQVTNILSFLLSFFGFSYVVHHIGVSKSLLIFPSTLMFAIVLTYLVPSLSVLFIMVSIIKAMIFSLQDPVKELLYIPTSEAIKFKAKAWIDVFGSRFAKAIGSTLCTAAGGSGGIANATQLRRSAEIPCLILALAILAVTYSIGLEFQELIASGLIVGEDSTITAGAALITQNTYELNTNSTSFNDGRRSVEMMKIRKGLKPGDVGYDGYDLQLFDGVFEDSSDDNISINNND